MLRLTISLSILLLLTACQVNEKARIQRAIQSVFDTINQSFQDKDEDLFRAQWHPYGYEKTLGGGLMLPGSIIYDNGRSGNYEMRVLIDEIQTYQGNYVVPVDVWQLAPEEGIYRRVFALMLTKDQKRFIILTMSPYKSDLMTITDRIQTQDPLTRIPLDMDY